MGHEIVDWIQLFENNTVKVLVIFLNFLCDRKLLHK
jgi:hypothetical protein